MALHPEINPSPEGLPLSIAAAALRAARASKTSHSGSAYFETGSTVDGDGVGIVTGPMAAEHGGIGRLDDEGVLHPLVDLEPLEQAAQAAQAQADSVREQAAKDAQTLREQMSKVAADADKASEQANQLAQSALDAANKADGKADTITTTVNGHESKLTELSASLESTRATADGALEKSSKVEATVGALSATLTRDYTPTEKANAKYAAKTELTATAEGLQSKITQTATTANSAVTTANSAKSTADKNTATISQVSKTAQGALDKASSVEQSLNGFKTTVSETYQPKGDYATKTELSQTSTSLTAKISTAQNTANTANSTANSAKSQANNLDTLIRMDTNGVRVGKIVSGKYAGCSCLMNANGSFDVVDSDNNIVARLDANSVTLAGGVFNVGVIGGADLYIGAQPLNMQQYESGLVVKKRDNNAILTGWQGVSVGSGRGKARIYGDTGVSINTGNGHLEVNGQVWDSVTLYNANGWKVMSFGKIVSASVSGLKIGGGSWDTATCPYVIPVGLRPSAAEVSNIANVANDSVSRRIYIKNNGQIVIQNMGGKGSTQGTWATITYIAG